MLDIERFTADLRDEEIVPDEILDKLWAAVRAEVSRRHTIADAPNKIREINQQVVAAVGAAAGARWDPRIRAAGGYPAGAVLSNEQGERFESLQDGNVLEPSDGPQARRWWKKL